MPLKTWTEKQLQDLTRLWATIPDTHALVEIIGKPYGAIETKATKLKLKRTAPNPNIGKTTSTPELDMYLKDHYLHTPVKTMAAAINKSSTFVNIRLRQLGLVQPESLKEHFKKLYQLKPGTISFNKGKKQSEYMSQEAIERTKLTRFKKGQKIYHEQFDGAISVRNDKSGRPYKYIRIAKSKWKLLQVDIWEKVNGPVPKGHIVAFKDRDSMNCVIENLELITRQQNMLRNSASINLTDGYILNCLSWRDKEGQEKLKNHPELVKLKRESIILNRTIYEQQQKTVS